LSPTAINAPLLRRRPSPSTNHDSPRTAGGRTAPKMAAMPKAALRMATATPVRRSTLLMNKAMPAMNVVTAVADPAR